MPRSPNALLHDISRAVLIVQEQVAGNDWDAYSKNPALQFVVERALTIIGEAVVQLLRQTPVMTESLTDHRQIIACRNILVHGYADLDQKVIWKIIQHSLPVLKAEVENLLMVSGADAG